MKEKYIVIRSASPTTRDLFLGRLSVPYAATSADFAVEVEDLERREIAALTRHADVVAVAPSMPMKLITPVKVEEATESTAARIRVSGLNTVRFNRSW